VRTAACVDRDWLVEIEEDELDGGMEEEEDGLDGSVEEDGLVDMLDDGIDAEILQEWFPWK
jgi:hypothetical protein